MSQHDMVLDNGPGLAVRTDMNSAIQALASSSSGPIEPTVKYAGQFWLDTTVAPNGTMRMRNQANNAWVKLFDVIDGTPSDYIQSAAADMFAGFKTGANAFRINDKADGTGTNVLTLTETGALSVAGGITATGGFTAGGATFIGNGTSAILSSAIGNVAGTVYLRPNGASNAAGQAVLDTNGSFTTAIITSNQNFISSSVSAVLSATGAGTVYLRPNGVANAAGQLLVDTSGTLNLTNNIIMANTTTFNSGAQVGVNVNANYRCKNGLSVAGGNYGGNWFNLLWNSSAMVLFVDNTNLGTINTTSDYRIKKDVAELPSMWERVKALKPISYTQAEFTPPMSDATAEAQPEEGANQPAPEPTFREDDIERWGFIAHEAQETLVGTAASGHRDMEDGVQGLQWAPILAATVRALQEAMARIEALEGAVA